MYTANSWHVFCVQPSLKREFPFSSDNSWETPVSWARWIQNLRTMSMQTFISFWDSVVKMHGQGVEKKWRSVFFNRRHLSGVVCSVAHQRLNEERVFIRSTKRTRCAAMQLRNKKMQNEGSNTVRSELPLEFPPWNEQTWKKKGSAKFTSKRIVHMRLSNKVHAARECSCSLACD